jgi:asparaginyl-tRNA synthetase
MIIIENKELIKTYKNLKEVNLVGWVKSIRSSGAISFIELVDGTDLDHVQLVIKKDSRDFDKTSELRTGASILVKGVVSITEGRKQPFEVVCFNLDILKNSDEDYPLQKKEHSYEFLREIAHLRARTTTFRAAFKIRSQLAYNIHKYFNENDFVYVHSPIITSNDCEGAGEAFEISTNSSDPFFSKKASLTVSGQLNAEAMAMAFKKVYTFGPTFRAEKSFTNRHASEFWMIEPEVAFIDLEQNMILIESFIKFIVSQTISDCPKEFDFFYNLKPNLKERNESLIKSEFKIIKYKEAIDILKDAVNNGHVFDNNQIDFGMDLGSEHERYLCEVHFKSPVFITNYPKEIKAFYMKQNADGTTVDACDLLVPGIGEIVGGSQREDDHNKIIERAKEMNIPLEDIEWYTDLRKYGYHSSAGFGLGFERLIMYITGIENIRDAILFPRTPGNIKF